MQGAIPISGETEEHESGWTVDTLRAAMLSELEAVRAQFGVRIGALESHLDERYETQTTALTAAFQAADKAVQAALQSAKEAVQKAEVSADKRFASVNEFRAQLADQASTFMPRSESTARWQALSEKLDTHATASDARFSKLETKIEAFAAVKVGGEEHTAKNLGLIGAFAGVAAVVGVVIALFTLLGR